MRGAIHEVEAPHFDDAGTRNGLWDAIGTQLTLVDYGGAPPLVGGKWQLEGILGRGGFGLVCAARDTKLPRRVAVKLLPSGPEVAFLMREARSLAQFEHPAIVTIIEVDEGLVRCGERSVQCGWIVMPLIDGETLDGWVKQTRPRAAAVVDIIVAVGRALAHAHVKGVLHRDLKPANIMIDSRGRPFVIDFGLAIATTTWSARERIDRGPVLDALGERSTSAGTLRGTPSYMAPEAVVGQPIAGSDQFSLAVVAWEALFGVHPWRATDPAPSSTGPTQVTAWQRERLVPVLERGMDSRPAARFATMDAFCDALAAAVSSRWRGRVATVGSAVALVGVLVGGSYWAGWAGSRGSPEAPVDASQASVVGPGLRSGSAECDGLSEWAGHWSLMGRIVWTEYSNQLTQVRPIGLNVGLMDDCGVRIQMDKFLPADASSTDEFLAGETTAAPVRVDGTSWALVYDIEFPGDRRTYGEKEHHQFALTLDRSSTGEPRVRGSFAKVQTAGGLVLRKGWVLGRRDRSPTLGEIDAHEFPCDARCRIHCAGDRATRACIERQCAPYAQPLADPCGPPSSDFVAPLRTRSERRQLRKGRRFGSVSTGEPGDCEQNATRVLGDWGLWRVTEAGSDLARLDVTADGCRLRASLRHAEAEGVVSMAGEITAMGIWYLAPEPPAAAAETLILAGTGPAFGIDLAEPGRLVRAFRP